MQFPFNVQKTVQASGMLLNLAGGKMDSTFFLNILYVAEREYLLEEGNMITGDSFVAMANGVVLGRIYNLIHGKCRQKEWSEYIKKEKYKLYLIKNPTVSHLNFLEKEKLKNVFERYGHLDARTVSEIMRDFPEWGGTFLAESHQKPFPVPIEKILKLAGKSEMVNVVKEKIREIQYYNKIFG